MSSSAATMTTRGDKFRKRMLVFHVLETLLYLGTFSFVCFALSTAIPRVIRATDNWVLWILVFLGMPAAFISSSYLNTANSESYLLKVLHLTEKALKAYEVEDKCATVPGKKKFMKERRFDRLERFFSSSPVGVPCGIQTFQLEYTTRNEDGVAIRVIKNLPHVINEEDQEGIEIDMPEVGSLEDVDVILVGGIPTSGKDRNSLDKARMATSRNLERLPKRLSDLRRNGAVSYACASFGFLVLYLVLDSVRPTMLLVIGAVSLNIFGCVVSGSIGANIVDKCWAGASDEEIERYVLEAKAPFATVTPMPSDDVEGSAVARSGEAFKDEEEGSSTGTSRSTVAEIV